MKLVLIGGHPKGFDEPFHITTKSGKILRTITAELKITPIFFDLWENQAQMDLGKIEISVLKQLIEFRNKKYALIALGRFTETAIKNNNIDCYYLPHPASRDAKFLKQLREGLEKYTSILVK